MVSEHLSEDGIKNYFNLQTHLMALLHRYIKLEMVTPE